MKITFFVTALRSGGAERTITYLAPYFAKKGNDVSIVSFDPDVFYEIAPNVKLITLGIKSSVKRSLNSIWKAFLRYYRINKYLIKEKPDIVICLLPNTVKYISLLHKILKFKLISSERVDPSTASKKEIDTRLKAFRESDAVIFQTKRAQKFYPADIIQKSSVIPNAVGNPYVYELSKSQRQIGGYSFLAIGRLENQQKDYFTMIEAFEKFSKKYPNYKLEIFGEGSDENLLRNFVKNKNLEDKIIFMGVHRNAILQASNAVGYILTSKYEGMPNALMEAMAVGLPCISTDCPMGPKELIEDGVNGILVPVGDSEAVYRAMVKIVEDPDFAKNLGKEAAKILEKHNVETISQRYLDFIIGDIK